MVVADDVVNRILMSTLVTQLSSSEHIRQPTGGWSRLLRRDDAWSASIVGAVPGDGQFP